MVSRDQPPLAVAGAPLVDHPVVVGLHAQKGQFLVLPLVEGLAAEPGQHVGEADRRIHVVGLHVGQALLLLPAPRQDLVERHRGVGERLEPDGGRQLGERVDQIVVEPPVAPRPVGGALLVAEHPALEVERGLVALHSGTAVVVLAGKPLGPQVGRLDHVVVHGDDAGDLCHGSRAYRRDGPGDSPNALFFANREGHRLDC